MNENTNRFCLSNADLSNVIFKSCVKLSIKENIIQSKKIGTTLFTGKLFILNSGINRSETQWRSCLVPMADEDFSVTVLPVPLLLYSN